MSGAHAARAGSTRAVRRGADLGREVLLTLAAVFGTACLVLVVLVTTLDLGVIVFRTGSMAPTLPTGAAALVRTVPAADVRVGEVVTVGSPLGSLPVTHRVVATEQLGDGSTRLRLRGDANDAEDPFPYDVREVRRVVAGVPGAGDVLARLSEPRAMAALTAGTALLVGWALWPRGGRPRPRTGPRPSRSGRPAVAARVAGVVLAAGALVGGTAGTPDAVAATPPPEGFHTPGSDRPRVLRLTSSLADGQHWSLSPGAEVVWRVEAAVTPPPDADRAVGSMWVTLVASGPLVEQEAVEIVVQACDTAWAADGLSCPGGLRSLPAPVTQDGALVDRAPAGQVTSDGAQAVLVRMRVPPETGDEAQGLALQLDLRVDAFGETSTAAVSATADAGAPAGPVDLARTGADLRPFAWAVWAVVLGTAGVTWSRDRRRRRGPAPVRTGTSRAS